MKSSSAIIILLLMLCFTLYFLGKKNGTTEIKATIINNQQLVQQIAELSALEVTGTSTTKLTNTTADIGFLNNLKNYFIENTLQVSIPYNAKFGVDMSKGSVDIKENDTAIVLTFPLVKLLSLQLQLDKMETMNQTGLFNSTSIGDMKQAQQQLYIAVNKELSNNKPILQKAQDHIAEIFEQYYKPLGYKVVCNFTQP